MGGFFQAIGDFIGNFVGAVLDFFTTIFEAFATYILEPVMNFLGFRDEVIITTSVIATKIFDEDTFLTTQVREALQYMKKGSIDALLYSKNFSKTGEKQFSQYYRFGKWYYVDYLPDAKINATAIANASVEKILKQLKGSNVYILDIWAMVPLDDDWCKYQLQEKYKYDIGADVLKYYGWFYKYKSCAYLPDSNEFLVTLSPLTLKRRVYHETIVTGLTWTCTYKTYKQTRVRVASIDDKQDKVTTSIWNYTTYSHPKCADVSTTPYQSSSSSENVDKDSVQPSTKTVQTGSGSRPMSIQQTVVKEHVFRFRSDTGAAIEEVTVTTLSQDWEISLDNSFARYDEMEFIYETTQRGATSDVTLRVPCHNNERKYIVKYTIPEDGTNKVYYWMYDPSDNKYSELSNPTNQVMGFDMYPIVLLRNMFWNVNYWDGAGGDKPPSITKERCEDTEEILRSIGLDLDELTTAFMQNPDTGKLQDVFFVFGVSAANDHWIVSKVLFELFDFIYDRLAPTVDSKGYSASFKENPYNAALVWTPRPPEEKSEKIGGVGRCVHSVVKETVVTKQIEVLDVVGTPCGYDNHQNYVHCWRKVTRVNKTITTNQTTGAIIKEELSEAETFMVYSTNEESFFDYKDDTSIIPTVEKYPIGHSERVKSTETKTYKNLVIKKQLTGNKVRILTVENLQSVNIVRRNTENGGVSLEPDDSNMVIPLPVPVVERLTIIERTALLGQAAHMIFYTYDKQVIKWYQTSAFASFLKIISIGITVVVTLFTFGTGSFASMSLSSVLFSVLESVAVGVALQLALHLVSTLVDDLGLKIALSVAAMAVAAFTLNSFSSGGFNFDMSFATKLAEMPIKAIDMVSQDINKKTMNFMMEASDILAQISERSAEYQELTKHLNSGLTASDAVSLMESGEEAVFNSTFLSMSQIYAMSINSPFDIDGLQNEIFNQIPNYFSNSLRLGSIEDDA